MLQNEHILIVGLFLKLTANHNKWSLTRVVVVSSGRVKDLKQEHGVKDEKKEKVGDVEKREKRERGADKKEPKEKKEGKRAADSNGIA